MQGSVRSLGLFGVAVVAAIAGAGCGYVECVSKEADGSCTTYDAAPADECPEELGGEWSSGTSTAGTFSDRTGAARCEVTNLVIYLDFAGLGDYGHVLGAYGMSGDVTVYDATGVSSGPFAFGSRLAPMYYMATVGDLRTTDDLTVEIYSGYSPDPITGAGGVLQAILTGTYDASSDTITGVKLSVDPSSNGSSDSNGCGTFTMPSSFTLYHDSANVALAVSEYESVSTAESEQLVECPTDTTTDTGDTGTTTQSNTSEDLLATIGSRPLGALDRDGRFPAATYTFAASFWNLQGPLEADTQAWKSAMHAAWNVLFVVPSGSASPPILTYWLPGAPSGAFDLGVVKTRGHSVIEWLSVSPVERGALGLVANRYLVGEISGGDFEWYVGSILLRSPAQPPLPQ